MRHHTEDDFKCHSISTIKFSTFLLIIYCGGDIVLDTEGTKTRWSLPLRSLHLSYRQCLMSVVELTCYFELSV